MTTQTASHPLPSSTALPVSSHRLPTVSASQALKDLQTSAPSPLTSGLSQLDALLAGQSNVVGLDSSSNSTGLQRGTVTEFWGPSGSGKTTLAMQFAAKALRAGDKVLWIDASTPLVPARLSSILASSVSSSSSDIVEKHASCLKSFHRLPVPTLSHLLTLLLHPPSTIPLPDIALVVIDNIHAPFDAAYARHQPTTPSFRPGPGPGPGGGSAEASNRNWASHRRYATSAALIGALRKTAALHSLAVVVTSNAVTRARGRGVRAGLVGAMGGVEWDRGLHGRVVCFRDYGHHHHQPCHQRMNEAGGEREGRDRDGKGRAWREGWFLGVLKAGGKGLVDTDDGEGEVGVVIPVEIGEEGMREVERGGRGGGRGGGGESGLPALVPSPVKQRTKRKFEEVGDSDEEVGSEYGWGEGDEIAAEGLIDEDDLVVLGERAVGGDQNNGAEE